MTKALFEELDRNGFSKKEIAERLNVAKSTLYSMMHSGSIDLIRFVTILDMLNHDFEINFKPKNVEK